jgi:predicted transcriptional regulator
MQVYRTTDKGNRFLHIYNQISELITMKTKKDIIL